MKNKMVISMLLILIISAIGVIMSFNNKNEVYNTKTLDTKTQTLSMMFETGLGTGVYEEQTGTSWPTSGYEFNETLSGCENGSEISWDTTNNKVVIRSNTSEKCYVYFDVAS